MGRDVFESMCAQFFTSHLLSACTKLKDCVLLMNQSSFYVLDSYQHCTSIRAASGTCFGNAQEGGSRWCVLVHPRGAVCEVTSLVCTRLANVKSSNITPQFWISKFICGVLWWEKIELIHLMNAQRYDTGPGLSLLFATRVVLLKIHLQLEFCLALSWANLDLI